MLGASACRAAPHAFQAGAVSDKFEFIAALAWIPFIALKARVLHGLRRVGQRFPLKLDLMRHAAIAVSVAIAAMPRLYAPSRGKQVRTDRRGRQALRIGFFI